MSSTTRSRRGRHCSFCGKLQDEVRRLIAGPGRVFICDDCVTLCLRVIQEEQEESTASGNLPTRPLPPKEIDALLGKYVIGQERARKVLGVAVYNHYKRAMQDSLPDPVEVQKSNILFMGPTGSGKTLLAQTLARILDAPFSITDATSLTEAGYVGEDVENILLRLIQAADFDISRAERGIIYIDEIDKVARKSSNPSITRDVSGEGVQQALLKIMEGCVANVPPQGGRKHPHQEFLQINTERILFICGGAFEGLQEIVEKRVSSSSNSIGFSAKPKRSRDADSAELLQQVSTDDLLTYGFIPEFIGRLPMLVSLDALGEDDLVRVLTEPQNALVKQYQHLFKLDNVELTFGPDALEATAEEALKHKTGARGLRSILEEALLDTMYDLPSIEGVGRCIVDADTIRGKKAPLLLTADGTPIASEQKKSA